jgi:putative protease
VTAEEVAEHIGRLGGTQYAIGAWSLELSPNAGVGFSALHRVRREALDAYESALLAPWADRRASHPSIPRLPSRSKRPAEKLGLVAQVADLAAARIALEAGTDRVLVSTLALGTAETPEGVVPLISRIVHDREAKAALARARRSSRIAIGNLGMVKMAVEAGAQVEADWGLNALNAHAVAALADLGAGFVWLSPELTGRQIAQIAGDAAVPVGVAVFGRQELMVTEHCILMAEGECDRRCGRCGRRAERRTLRDRKGYEFPVITDITGRSHLYNSVSLDLSSSLDEIVAAGISAVRLELELETERDIRLHVSRFRQLLDRLAAGLPLGVTERPQGTTSGHYFRGVL